MVTHKYHRALTMQAEPTEYDWYSLDDVGLGDNAFVKLTDVQLTGIEEMVDGFGDFGEFDPDADPEEIQAQFAEMMEDMEPMDLMLGAFAPIKIIPDGADPEDTPDLIIIPRNPIWMEEAARQMEDDGFLQGYMSVYTGPEMMEMMSILVGEEFIADEDTRTVYMLEPMSEPIDRSQASSNFWLIGFCLSFGLILCASGGPSIVCCVFFMLPSLISLIGYPMRYGRGGTMTRLLYLVIGAGFVGYGYTAMFVQGQFGQINGNPFLHAIGFASLFVGLAGMLSIPTQIIARKLFASVEVKPRKPPVKMSLQQACSLTPVDAQPDYEDPEFSSASDAHLQPEMQMLADALEPLDFTDQQNLQHVHGGSTVSSMLLLGCKGMVVADIESVGGAICSRLVSVLHDGMTIVTISRNTEADAASRVGANGCYQKSGSVNPIDMMSEHLDRTAELAEKRDSTVVHIDADEITDVSKLGRRVLADVRSQFGEVVQDINYATYGRFRFPPQRIIGELAHS